MPSLILAGTLGALQAPDQPRAPDLPDLSGTEPQVVSAIRITHEQLTAEPDSAARWGAWGRVLDAHGFALEAVAAYERAAELEPGAFTWPYLQGFVTAREDPVVALDLYRKAIDLDGTYAPVYVRVGALLERQGDAAAARAAYERALAIEPDNPFARAGLGQRLLDEGDLDAARHHLERAVELLPECKPALSGLATYARLTGDLPAARAYAERAAAAPEGGLRDPLRHEVEQLALSTTKVLHQVQMLRRAGRNAAARQRLLTLLEGNPHSARALSQLGELDLEAGYRAQALATFRRAVDADREFVPGRLGLAHALRLTGQVDAALAEYEAVLVDHPSAVRAHTGLAACLAALGRLDESVDRFKQALELAPDDRRARAGYGWVLFRQGQFEPAVRALRPVVAGEERDSVWAQASGYLGLSLVRLGRPKDAVAPLEAALELRPDGHEVRIALAEALVKSGRDAAALATLRRGLERTPQAGVLAIALGRLLATSADPAVRDGARALELAEQLAAATGRRHVEVLEVLACAYAENDRFGEAVAVVDEALALPASGDPAVRTRIERLREQFDAGRPVRTSSKIQP